MQLIGEAVTSELENLDPQQQPLEEGWEMEYPDYQDLLPPNISASEQSAEEEIAQDTNQSRQSPDIIETDNSNNHIDSKMSQNILSSWGQNIWAQNIILNILYYPSVFFKFSYNIVVDNFNYEDSDLDEFYQFLRMT